MLMLVTADSLLEDGVYLQVEFGQQPLDQPHPVLTQQHHGACAVVNTRSVKRTVLVCNTPQYDGSEDNTCQHKRMLME